MMTYLARRHRSTILILFALSLLSVVSSPAFALEMRTVVKNFVTTEWTLECPNGEILDLTTVNMTDEGIVEFMHYLGQVESENGFHISSQTVVENSVVISDEIVSTTDLTEEQVNKLKEIIDAHQIHPKPVPFNQPRIESVLLDGVLDSFVIVLPDGCVIDLTDVDIDPQVLQQLIQLLQQFETQNGVHVTGATTVKDGETEKDRVIQITYLMPEQIQQILQFFQSHGIALLLGQKLVPVTMDGDIFMDGEHIPFNVDGDAQIQFQPPDNNGIVPIQIVSLNLQSVQPITVELENPEQWQVMVSLEPVDNTGKLNVVSGQIPDLIFNNVGPGQDTLLADPDFTQEFDFFGCGLWPFHEAMHLHSPGRKHLVSKEPSTSQRPVLLKIDHFELGLPLRVPVIPDGIGN